MTLKLIAAIYPGGSRRTKRGKGVGRGIAKLVPQGGDGGEPAQRGDSESKVKSGGNTILKIIGTILHRSSRMLRTMI